MGLRIFSLISLFALVSCGSSPKKASDIKVSAVEFQQKIEEFSVPEPTAPKIEAAGIPEKKMEAKDTAKNVKKKGSKREAAAAKMDTTWSPKAWPFGIGETLTFGVRYGPIEGGVVTLEVMPPKVIDGVPVLHYHASAKSSRVLELFYTIDNEMNSYVSLVDHQPLRLELSQTETARTGKRVVVFDQSKKVVKYYSKLIKKSGEVEEIRRDDAVTNFAQDLFGGIYFYRFIDDLKMANFPIHDRWKEWNSELKFLGTEKIHVPAGEFDTVRFGVVPRISGNLESKGEAEMWITNDVRKMLVKFKAKVKIGAITGDLRAYRPGKEISLPLPLMKTPINLKSVAP